MVRRQRILSTLKQGRLDALKLMVDVCTVARPTGRFEVDPDTGVTRPVVDTVYHGACRVQTAGGVASQVVSASGDSTNVGGNVPVWNLYLHLPYTASGCRPGDIALIESSNDMDLVGARLRLVNLQSEKTLATALYLHLPYTASGCRPGDIALIESSNDMDLVGARLRLVNLQSEKTLATARRWNVSQMPAESEVGDE